MARPKSSSSKAEGIAKIDPPELQISLHYRSLTGRLEVAVLKARSLGSMLTSAKQGSYISRLNDLLSDNCMKNAFKMLIKERSFKFASQFSELWY